LYWKVKALFEKKRIELLAKRNNPIQNPLLFHIQRADIDRQLQIIDDLDMGVMMSL
jgi:hypothetical protein